MVAPAAPYTLCTLPWFVPAGRVAVVKDFSYRLNPEVPDELVNAAALSLAINPGESWQATVFRNGIAVPGLVAMQTGQVSGTRNCFVLASPGDALTLCVKYLSAPAVKVYLPGTVYLSVLWHADILLDDGRVLQDQVGLPMGRGAPVRVAMPRARPAAPGLQPSSAYANRTPRSWTDAELTVAWQHAFRRAPSPSDLYALRQWLAGPAGYLFFAGTPSAPAINSLVPQMLAQRAQIGSLIPRPAA